jgi:excisionase family DNA binding protein
MMPVHILGNTLYDLTEAAELLGVSRRTCHQYVLDGKIAAQMIGKKWMIHEDAIREFLRGEKRSTSVK